MYLRSFFQIIVVTTTIVQYRAEDGMLPVLGHSDSTHLQRSSEGLNFIEKKEHEQNTAMNHIRKRALEVATTRLFDAVTKALNLDDDCCCCGDGSSNEISPTSTPNAAPSLNPSVSAFPSINPTLNPTYSEKKFFTSDGNYYDLFGWSCSISNDLVVIGVHAHASEANEDKEAVYLFHLDGTEVKKLTIPGDDVQDNDFFGISVSMDDKIVVGSYDNYVAVFSREGIFERTITCGNGCTVFGGAVATLGNLIVTHGRRESIWSIFIFTTEGELVKEIEQEGAIHDVAISNEVIVLTGGYSKTTIYSNTSPDFPEIAEINQGGLKVAVSNERLVIGEEYSNGNDGEAYLYKIDGTLVTTLDRQDASGDSYFGSSVAITNDKVLIGAERDNDQGSLSGSVFIYSAITGEFDEKVLAPDGQSDDWFGTSMCASDSYYVVGTWTGAAYLFQLP